MRPFHTSNNSTRLGYLCPFNKTPMSSHSIDSRSHVFNAVGGGTRSSFGSLPIKRLSYYYGKKSKFGLIPSRALQQRPLHSPSLLRHMDVDLPSQQWRQSMTLSASPLLQPQPSHLSGDLASLRFNGALSVNLISLNSKPTSMIDARLTTNWGIVEVS